MHTMRNARYILHQENFWLIFNQKKYTAYQSVPCGKIKRRRSMQSFKFTARLHKRACMAIARRKGAGERDQGVGGRPYLG